MEKRGERLRAILAERGMSIRELSRLAGIGQSTVQAMIENNFKGSSVDRVIAIAEALDIKVHDFIIEAKTIDPACGSGGILRSTLESRNENLEVFKKTSRDMYMKKTEYYGQISAGERSSLLHEESNELIELPKFLFGKYANRNDAFVMKTSGDSMNKIIPNGSYIICIPVEGHHELKNGDIVIYTYENESSMKRYSEKGDYNVFSPESYNDEFFDFVVSKETINNVKIDAKVVAYHVILE